MGFNIGITKKRFSNKFTKSGKEYVFLKRENSFFAQKTEVFFY